MEPRASGWVTAAFVVLPVLVAAAFVAACAYAGGATRRRRVLWAAAGALLWMGATAALAASGALRRFDATPPPFAVLFLGILAIGIALPLSPVGARLVRSVPLWALVGFQVFRLPLELAMHRAHVEGVMPAQMSYSGWNFDIVTGITAGSLAIWLARGRPPRWIVVAWNALGTALLFAIMGIAVASTPLFRAFGDANLNTFVTYPPFVWLPAVLVAAALMGHVLVWRWLARVPADVWPGAA